MKKIIIVLLFIFVAFSLSFIISNISKKISYTIKKEVNSYKENIDKQIIINGDTLKIVDYKVLTNSYKLSNGLEVSKDFVNKQLVISTKTQNY